MGTEGTREWYMLAQHMAAAVVTLLRLQAKKSPPVPLQSKIAVCFLFCLIYMHVTLELPGFIVNNEILTDEKVSPCPFLKVQLSISGTPNLPASSLVIPKVLPKSLAICFGYISVISAADSVLISPLPPQSLNSPASTHTALTYGLNYTFPSM